MNKHTENSEESLSGWENVPYPDEDEEIELLEGIIYDFESNRDIPLYADDDGIMKIYAYEKVPESAYLDAKKRLKAMIDAKNKQR